jgi:hypothetical protein
LIDPRFMIDFDTEKENANYLKLSHLLEKPENIDFDQCKLLILKCDSWMISIKTSHDEFSGLENFWVIRHKHLRLTVPSHIPIILLMKTWGPKELINNYRVFNL